MGGGERAINQDLSAQQRMRQAQKASAGSMPPSPSRLAQPALAVLPCRREQHGRRVGSSVRAYDPHIPLVCLDETSRQLLGDKRDPRGPQPDRPQQVDYEYEREGVVNLFLFCEPLARTRWVTLTDHRTKVDWAHRSKNRVDERHPHAEQIRLVCDNLNTHTPASRYEAFPPAEAKRLADKLEIHPTPKHDS